ncbi:hypothetical protein [Massilia timonae]|uniref:hypothetical protein n=1 Tax=Massilia timonae TaxID=47229 RepID=UPI0028D8B050|nr:hypothetical protein [Massilia timonae]
MRPSGGIIDDRLCWNLIERCQNGTHGMAFTRCPNPRGLTVALLYQAMPPPVIDGIRKDPKPGGYADSGADIVHALRMAGVKVATPQASPDPARDLDWVFPDTPEGIAAGRARADVAHAPGTGGAWIGFSAGGQAGARNDCST